jgi:4-carboxymuconolactone decarboxylase
LTSGARIGRFEPSALDAEQRSLYDAIAGGRRAQGPQLFRLADADGRLEGPFNAFLLQPRLGSALQALGASVRYDTGLDDRCREIAILVVAAHWRSDFEWYAHEAVGRAAGLDDAEYREAVDCIGPAGLFELLTLVGYYATLALQLRVFRVPVPEDTAPTAQPPRLDTVAAPARR